MYSHIINNQQAGNKNDNMPNELWDCHRDGTILWPPASTPLCCSLSSSSNMNTIQNSCQHQAPQGWSGVSFFLVFINSSGGLRCRGWREFYPKWLNFFDNWLLDFVGTDDNFAQFSIAFFISTVLCTLFHIKISHWGCIDTFWRNISALYLLIYINSYVFFLYNI